MQIPTTRFKPSDMDALKDLLVEKLMGLAVYQALDLPTTEWNGPARGPASFINTRFHKKDPEGPRFSVRKRSDGSGWLIIRTK